LWSSAEAELRVNPPNVRVDNSCSPDATVITVDSANRSGVLLEVVQTLTEMNFVIPYAIISSDGGWFVDVFHVTTEDGRKIADPVALQRIEKMLASEAPVYAAGPRGLTLGGADAAAGGEAAKYAVIELSVIDRPGLLSDVTSLLAKQNLSVISAATWSQHLRAALVIFVEAVGVPDVAAASHSHAHGDASDSHQPSSSSAEISAVTPALPPPPSVALPPAPHLSFMLRDRLDAVRQMIETQLGSQASMIHVGTITDPGHADLDRRLHRVLSTPVPLHRMMAQSMGEPSCSSFNNMASSSSGHSASSMDADMTSTGTHAKRAAVSSHAAPRVDRTVGVNIDNNIHPGYSLVCVRCADRPALLFDTVCVLFVSEYDVNHATIGTSNGLAEMEFYVRTKMGSPIESVELQEQLKQGLLEACQRRGSRFRLELTANDRPGLLADVTKKLAESGLMITKAEVSRKGESAVEKFLVESDGSNNHLIDTVSMRRVCMEIGQTLLEGGHVQVDQRGDGYNKKELNRSETVLESWITSGWA